MDTRQRIKYEAKMLFAKEGYSGFSMGNLALACEKNKATLYYYYPSKQELYNEIVMETLTEFQTHIGTSTLPQGTAHEQIKAYINTLLDQDIVVIKLLQRLILEDKSALYEPTYTKLLLLPKSFEAIYKAGIGNGAFKILQPLTIFHMITGAIFGHRLFDATPNPHFGEEIYTYVMQVIVET